MQALVKDENKATGAHVIQQKMERAEFSRYLPHSGPMLLLNRVESWCQKSIECSAVSHNDVNNPLRINGRLSTVHAIEYGAQAAAIHLFAIASVTAEPELSEHILRDDKIVFLGVVRDFECSEIYLDEVPGSVLNLRSELISSASRIYQYHVSASINGRLLAHGSISLIVGN